MKFIKVTDREDTTCYIPVSSIARISIIGNHDYDELNNEFKVYCVAYEQQDINYYDLAGPFDTRELAESAMAEIVKGINYDD